MGRSRASGALALLLLLLALVPLASAQKGGGVQEHHGDLVVTGCLRLYNTTLIQHGSIIISPGGCLELELASIILNQSGVPFKYNVTCRGGSLKLLSSKLTGDMAFLVFLLSNASLVAENSTIYVLSGISASGTSRLRLSRCSIGALSLSDHASARLEGTRASNVTCSGSARAILVDCEIGNITVSDNAVAAIYETVCVRVLRGGEPVEGAAVEIYWPNGTLVGRGTTNSTGHACFVLCAEVLREGAKETFTNYTAKVRYRGEELTATLYIAYESYFELDLRPPFPVQVLCLDADGQPAPGVLVEARGPKGKVARATSGEDGRAVLTLVIGNYTLTAYKLGVLVAELEVELEGSRTIELRCSLYAITVVARDDEGSPLRGARVTLAFEGQANATFTAITDREGRATFRALPPGDYRADVRFGDREVKLAIRLEEASVVEEAVFDLHPPVIERVEFKPEVRVGEGIAVVAYIRDAFGRVVEARVRYRVEGEGGWHIAVMEFKGDRWECVLPGQGEACVVKFYVEAVDDAGNRAVSQIFTVSVARKPLLAGREYVAIAIIVIASVLVAAALAAQAKKGVKPS